MRPAAAAPAVPDEAFAELSLWLLAPLAPVAVAAPSVASQLSLSECCSLGPPAQARAMHATARSVPW